MKKLKIQDWALCLGRNVEGEHRISKLISVDYEENEFIVFGEFLGSYISYKLHEGKPILRTVEQMTEEEKEVYEEIEAGLGVFTDLIEKFDYLTRIGIDIRGWIDKGLAIKYDPKLHGEWI